MGILKIANIEDQFSALVDTIRATGTITSSSVVNGVVTIQSANSLRKGEIIGISTEQYKILSANSSEFSVKSDVDLSGDWKALAPYFMDGHLMEISGRLAKQDVSTLSFKYQKYPLIVLLQDFTMSESAFSKNTEIPLNIVIVNKTEKEYNTKERRDNNFTPILDPIYNDLIKAIKDDSFLNLTDSAWSLTRRYYWGSVLNNKNIFNDFLDAIEISNLNLEITKKC